VVVVKTLVVVVSVDVLATVVVDSVLRELDVEVMVTNVVVSSLSGFVVFKVEVELDLDVEVKDDSEAAVEVWLLVEDELEVSGLLVTSEDEAEVVFNS